MFAVNRNPSSAVLRSFGRAMLGGFLVLGALLWYRGAHTAAFVLWTLGAVLFATSLVSALGRPVYVAWMTGAMFLGGIATTVGLTVLFVLFLPFFTLIRFSDPLRRKLRAHGSYWEPHKPHEATLERCERPF